MRKLWKKPEGLVQPFNNHNGIVYERNISDFFNQDIVRRGESSSAAANCTARGYPVIFIQNLNFRNSLGLAVLAAAMANKGSFQGKMVLSSAGREALHANNKCILSLHLDPNIFY